MRELYDFRQIPSPPKPQFPICTVGMMLLVLFTWCRGVNSIKGVKGFAPSEPDADVRSH